MIGELDEACEVYFEAVQERLPLTKAEKEAKESLIDLMISHGRKMYTTADGKIVSLTDSHNVHVKAPKSRDEEENGDDE